MLFQSPRACFLQSGIVIIIEIIETDDLLSSFEQELAGSGSDEACGTCDEYGHGVSLTESLGDDFDDPLLI